MGRYGSPSLFIAVNSFNRDTKEVGHLTLCFFYFFSDLLKFFTGYAESLAAGYAVGLIGVKENDHNL